ncbi:hypothetical protein [Fibrella aquatilis]|uniref:Uncharacterized protein n=1 Tax=Fibrella aquatilis TaxID=2817059 RepID=A0A939JYX3_9BACT|nr:hypothetical protein [Fibrella aquatilis]MBO0929590.1 hypothetical protein [Fibrella aquatilis]
MQKQSELSEKSYFFKKLKTYTAEEIIAAGGTTAFGKVTHYDREALNRLDGEPLTEEEYQQAIEQLSK